MAVQGIEDKDPALQAIHVSIQFDKRMWREDIAGSRAHVAMLGRCGILTEEEVDAILGGLNQVETEIHEDRFPFRREFEDIHLNVEQRLFELIGPVAGKLHTGRSRNDQVATDLRLWLRNHTPIIQRMIGDLALRLCGAAKPELEAHTVLPFYTHLQRAQPVLLAHHLLAHVSAFERDWERLRDAALRANESPLGSGAGAGSGYPIDANISSELLGFRRPCKNSIDAVSARDFALEWLAAASILAVHMSRLAEELILWSSQEFAFCTLSSRVTTGSSIMPQKRNPDGAELVRGKSGRIIGQLQGLLVTLKGLPFAYNKDFQEDKEAIFEVYDTLTLCLKVLIANLNGIQFNREKMRAAACAKAGYANATELADYLVSLGLPFRDAHAAVKALVNKARESDKSLEELSLEEFQAISSHCTNDVYEVLKVETAIAKRTVCMGTAAVNVERALAGFVEQWTARLG